MLRSTFPITVSVLFLTSAVVAAQSVEQRCQTPRTQYDSDFIAAMPTNLYGPQDNFDLNSSHVLPALIRKLHHAKQVGRHEVDDLADTCVFLMEHHDAAEHINVGTGEDLSIRELAEMAGELLHSSARLVFDATKPDGTPRKLLDVSRLHGLGWRRTIELRSGIAETYEWFLHQPVEAA